MSKQGQENGGKRESKTKSTAGKKEERRRQREEKENMIPKASTRKKVPTEGHEASVTKTRRKEEGR